MIFEPSESVKHARESPVMFRVSVLPCQTTPSGLTYRDGEKTFLAPFDLRDFATVWVAFDSGQLQPSRTISPSSSDKRQAHLHDTSVDQHRAQNIFRVRRVAAFRSHSDSCVKDHVTNADLCLLLRSYTRTSTASL